MGGLLIEDEAGRGAFTIFRLALNATSMAFDNRLVHGQANARATSVPFLWMEMPEDLEDVIAVLFPDSEPVVFQLRMGSAEARSLLANST